MSNKDELTEFLKLNNANNQLMSEKMTDISVNLAVVKEKMINMDARVGEIVAQNEVKNQTFVTKEEFKPVKTIVYTVTSIMGIAVITALLSYVVVPNVRNSAVAETPPHQVYSVDGE